MPTASAVRQPDLALGNQVKGRAGCRIEGAIVDKNACIGEATTIVGRPGSGVDPDGGTHHVRHGVVILPRDQPIPPGTEIMI